MTPLFLKRFKLLLLLITILSLFFPFIQRLNIHTSDPSISKLVLGKEMFTPFISLVLMCLIYLFFYIQKLHRIIIWIVLVIYGLSVVLVRKSIHFQGFIDHDYDTKTGIGFYVMFVSAVIYSGLIVFELLRKSKH
jgi:hypothetical protein